MTGPDIESPEHMGIIPWMVRHIFAKIEKSSEDIEFTVKVSMVEIYLEKIWDLLDPKKFNLEIWEDKKLGIYIEEVTETYVTDVKEVMNIMRLGNDNRAIGATDMNKQSSRSHSIFMMTLT